MHYRRFAAVALVLAISACASNQPQQQSYVADQARRLGHQAVAVVVDSCVVRDEIGADIVLRDDSETLGQQLGDVLVAELRRRGHVVTSVQRPYLCGYVGGKLDITQIAANDNSPRESTRLPIARAAGAPRDETFDLALLSLINQATDRVPTSQQKDGPAATDLRIDTHAQAVLRDTLGADSVWVVHMGGVDVSMGKSMGIAMLTGMLTLGATGGGAAYVSTPTDGNGYHLALVDLADRQILWKKSQAQARTSTPAFSQEWAISAFDPFYPVVDVTDVVPAAPAPTASPLPSPQPLETRLAASLPPPPVAEPAPAAPIEPIAGSEHVLATPLSAAAQPRADSRPMGTIAAGQRLRLEGQLLNAEGRWWFTRAGDIAGWVRESALVVALTR